MTQTKITGVLNKISKRQFVIENSQTIANIIRDGYDSYESIVLENLLKKKYGCNKNTNRKTLLSSFIKVYCELNNPGFVIVGNKTVNVIDYHFNPEQIINKDLTDKRIMDFIEMKDRINK